MRMVDGTYKLKVDVLIGRRYGKIVLRTEDDVLYADINAPIIGRQKVKGTVDGDSFVVKGSGMVFPLGMLRYTLTGEVDGDNITVKCRTNKGNLTLKGQRV